MTRAWFEYKGINSMDMHLYIENDVAFSSPEADVEFVEVAGKDGELAIDNKRLRGTRFPLPVRLKTPQGVSVDEMANKISNWLKSDIGWHELKFSGSPGYVFTAMCHEQFDIRQTLINYGQTVIVFRLKPTKICESNSNITIENGTILHNPEVRTSKPLIRIEGSGPVTVQNNGVDWLKLYSIDNYINIDSEAMAVYRELGNDENIRFNSTLRPLFPLLEPGENKITWSGNITKFEVNPRWEAIN